MRWTLRAVPPFGDDQVKHHGGAQGVQRGKGNTKKQEEEEEEEKQEKKEEEEEEEEGGGGGVS